MRPSSIVLAAIALTFGSETAAAQGTFRSAEVSKSGELRVLLSRKQVITPAKDSGQVGVEQVRISGDHRVVGWLARYENCCTTYPIPLKLILLGESGKRTVIANDLPIWEWWFVPVSGAVGIRQAPVHGNAPIFYALHDRTTGRLLATASVDTTSSSLALPAWVKMARR